MPPRHSFTTRSRLSFSRAAATRSLSFSCLLIAASWSCLPGVALSDPDWDSPLLLRGVGVPDLGGLEK